MGRLTVCRIWSEAIPAAVCDLIIELGNEKRLEVAKLRPEGADDFVDESIRKTKVVYWDATHWVNGLTSLYIRIANEEIWNYDLVTTQGVQFGRYDIGGTYDWHKDEFDQPFGDEAPPPWQGLSRKLSVAVNLSAVDDYEGGQLLFKDTYGIEMVNSEEHEKMRLKGSVTVFPAYTPHTVTPVTSGVRYSLVSWMLGPPFR